MLLELSEEEFRHAVGPLLDRLIDEKVEQRRPMLLTPKQVAYELSCSVTSVYGLINTGALEAIEWGRSRRVATEVLQAYVAALATPQNRWNPAPPVTAAALPKLQRRLRPSTPPSRRATPDIRPARLATASPRRPRAGTTVTAAERRAAKVAADARMHAPVDITELARIYEVPEERVRQFLAQTGLMLHDGAPILQDLLAYMKDESPAYHAFLDDSFRRRAAD